MTEHWLKFRTIHAGRFNLKTKRTEKAKYGRRIFFTECYLKNVSVVLKRKKITYFCFKHMGSAPCPTPKWLKKNTVPPQLLYRNTGKCFSNLLFTVSGQSVGVLHYRNGNTQGSHRPGKVRGNNYGRWKVREKSRNFFLNDDCHDNWLLYLSIIETIVAIFTNMNVHMWLCNK